MYSLFILCGGKGSRIRSKLDKLPKSLAIFNSRPFIISLIEKWTLFGIRKVVLCLGYKAKSIENVVSKWSKKKNIEVLYSYENKPLGTGGAIKYALKKFSHSKKIIICNGDTWIDGDISFLLKNYRMNQLVIKKIKNTGRYGSIKKVKTKIKGFYEKIEKKQSDYISLGISILHPEIITNFDSEIFSLENDLYPKIVKNNQLNAIVTKNLFFDFGIPKDFDDFELWTKKNSLKNS